MNELKPGQPYNVLIVDDEKAVSATISFIVKHLGHTVDVVNDGEPALEKIRQSPGHYQLVITDHSMLTMDGLMLVDQLKRLHFPGRIMVISGYLDRKLEASYRSFGVDKIMDKPFDPCILRSVIRELTGSPEISPQETAHPVAL